VALAGSVNQPKPQEPSETTEKVPFFKQRFVEKLILLKENQ